MPTVPTPNDVLALLADDERLRCFAASVLGPGTTTELAERAGLQPARATKALGKLSSGGLVRRHGDGWVADVETLRTAAREAAAPREPGDLGDATDASAAVLRAFFREGRLETIPAQRSKRLVVLDHIARAFDVGVHYPEREVNELLRVYHDDVAALRRYLVDEGMLSREAGEYWRTGGSVDV